MKFESQNLRPLNKFGVNCIATNYFRFTEVSELDNLAKSRSLDQRNVLILGGGSNILLPEKFDGVVLHPCNDKIELLDQDLSSIIVRAHAGLEWDRFVTHCVGNGWGGLENLSLIPGNVGAAPVQNIGAYGREACELIEQVTCYDLATNEVVILSKQNCEFSYRNSIFKRRPELLVISVDFKLHKPRTALLRSLKGDKKSISGVAAEFKKIISLVTKDFRFGPKTKWRPQVSFDNIRTLLDIDLIPISLKRRLVCLIRRKTMPDPAKIGNVGCFFKSPIVKSSIADSIKTAYPKISLYPGTPGTYKVSAGDLIRECGWAGKKIGDVSINARRPLIILNHGNASAKEILNFSKSVQSDVQKKFNITIEPEVVIVQ
ncbi:FAD-binding protein [Pseudomonas sp. R3.Fl]|uniref:FAD-binding protein n=1 Tax=Pseudomonas sp. R3.Fl TaxID=2928708 RepID=UPI00201D8AE1|nr:FAD-binding protein [Pseudomonas sp. R3.Fl]MCL6688668.1 FAD-binding protein [Pseudomonas sp. R3.Fl]